MCFAVIVGLHCHQMMFKCSGLEYFLIGLKLGLHFHHSVSYRLKQWCGQFGSKYRSCNIWTLKCFILSYKSNATELSWFVYFEQMKNSRVLVVVTENLRKRSECLLQLLKWMLAETGDMSHKFFIDPRPVTLHTVFEKNIASTQRAGVGEMQLVIDVRSCQCHLTLNYLQFFKE